MALFAHSYGANCALGASAPEVSHAVLYEPSLGLRYPPFSETWPSELRAVDVVVSQLLGRLYTQVG